MGNTLTTYTTKSKNTMQLFPYALIRVGGDSFEEWSRLNFPASNEIVREIYRLTLKQAESKEALCDSLFEFISNSDNPEIQNTVQNLRRDIFNERRLKNSKINKAAEVLPQLLKESLEGYIALLKELKEKTQAGESVFAEELHGGREQLKQLVDSEHFKKGLILSSRTLLNRLDSFKKRPADTFRKKEHQVEQSLLQYLTRMYAKTSPFSTFTNLSMGAIREGQGNIQISALGGLQVKGHIRLNNYLLKYVMDLLKNYRPSYILFPLRCNPTYQNREDHFLYLTNNNNIESFQRIPYNPVVEHIAGVVQEYTEGVRFIDLIEGLQNDIDASAEEVESYIKQLIEFGLLEYNVGVSGVDPDWDVKLVSALESQVQHGVQYIAELLDALKAIRQLGNKYAQSNVQERHSLLQQAYDTFREIYMKIHEEAGLPADERKTEKELIEEAKRKKEEEEKKKKDQDKSEAVQDEKDAEEKEEVTFKHETSTYFAIKPEQMFYEDTTREVNAVLGQEEVFTIISNLNELLNQMRFFKGNEEEKEKMRAYFLKKYGKNEPVDLLTFYEDYFREFKKPEKEREEKRKKEAREKLKQEQEEGSRKNGANEKDAMPETAEDKEMDTVDEFALPGQKEKQGKIMKWKAEAKKQLKKTVEWDAHEINVDIEPFKYANKEVGFVGTDGDTNSYGSFLQFYYEGGKLKAALNSTFPGYGKMVSRFLHIFDHKLTDEIRNWNVEQSDEESLFIEDIDASYFNANLHPTLMPYEIWMPGGHNSLPADKQIPITDFQVEYSAEADELNLIHVSTGKRAYVFDLGFQGHSGRSQLFQLLEKFTKAEYLFAQPLVNAVNQLNTPEENSNEKGKEVKEDKKEINVLPRVVYKDMLVLQRKTWFVPKVLLPQRHPNDTDWQYFKNINTWRKGNNMPDEVFVFVNTNRWGDANMDEEAMKKLTRDDYKPQYIDFTNPLLVSLLEKLIDRVPLNMKIVEMLPDSKQMLKIDDSRFVSEFVVQWYNK
ncbi:lantibiotic dehydratase family protein [Fulvivirga ulvae]|uniref:lantibiotic dehydratase n=1 Tax=Fulvivirga ulvae TaxID=2904245 RepID=UPI001F485672|nr:lantibiotic dehydratase [Fulvivirga ulvae]UII30240.1 lantibiotic dehydratase family protein [Fulvivirga ulvae]